VRDGIIGRDVPIKVSNDISAAVGEHQAVPNEGICKLCSDLHGQPNIETPE
jgi:hypothetical protein